MQTNRDQQIVAWVGELGAAGAEHVGARFAMGRSWTYRRLQLLVADGQLAERRLLHRKPGLYLATAEGLRWTGLERLGVHRVGPGGFQHAVHVARVAAELPRLGARGVLSERTLRALEAQQGRLIASVQVGALPGGRPALHRPDLAVSSETGVVAIEVELSVKAPKRLEAICRGYARARHLERVMYLATREAGRAVERATDRVRARDRITVLGLENSAALAAEVGRALR